MKEILMFYLPTCPHCKNAFAMVEELKAENPAFAALEIKTIDESVEKELAASYDYFFVPTYFVGGVNLHEGVPSKEEIRAVLQAALQG